MGNSQERRIGSYAACMLQLEAGNFISKNNFYISRLCGASSFLFSSFLSLLEDPIIRLTINGLIALLWKTKLM